MLRFRIRGEEPLLVVMDSLGWANNRQLRLIREYIREEWVAKEGHKFSVRDFSEKGIPAVRPSFLPTQPNWVDCGLYLLTFVEEMLKW